MKSTKPTEHTKAEKELYVFLDVHKNSTVCGIARAGKSDAEVYGKWGGSNQSVERGLRRLLKKYELSKESVSIAYEAGPTGFVLARRLLQLGYDAIVVAPSKIPRKAGDKVKNDRRDCKQGSRYLRAGELTAVHIPPAHDEAIRDLARARTDASEAGRKCKQQLGMFLLRNGIRYTGKTSWTEAHMNYLRTYKFNSPSQQIVLEDYLTAIDASIERVTRLEKHMENLLPEWDKKPYVDALMAFRGFKTVAAMTITSELGVLTRFPHPRNLMGYLGVVPSEGSSGETRKQGSITKCGNSHARWMLIECAGHYKHEAKVSAGLSKRQAGQSREVKAISWRAQNRLCFRFRKLSARKLHRNRAVVAVARELLAFIWEMHRQVTKELEMHRQVTKELELQTATKQ